MNYFAHHIGDYAAATAHLTWDEDMAYTRLLRAYYHHESGIKEGQQYRLARATTPAQVKAVDVVIGEFFTLDGTVFIQKRAEEEIAAFRAKSSKASDSAKARWTQCERNAKALPTHCEGIAPNNQEPITKQTPPPPSAEAPGGAFAEFWDLWPLHPRKVARKQCKQKWSKNGLDAVSEAVMAGLRASVASEAWSKAGGEFVPAPLVWLNQARWEAPTEAQAVEAVNAEHWHESRQGIEGKGADLGLGRWDEAKFSTGQGEQWPAYRARVFRAAGYHTLRSANG